ncbi:MAG: phosphatidylinositol mannoside acyltransferase [Ilumatobacteraceae bacterium]
MAEQPSEFDRARKRLADAVTVGSFRAGALAARLMPGPVALGAASSIGFTASLANSTRRRMIERHLQRVNPRLRGPALRVAVGQAFDSYAKYYMESFRLPHLSKRTVADGLYVDGWDNVTRAVASGRGTIFALPHMGGWEWAGRWMADKGYKMTVVVEALDPPELFEWFADLRKELGMTIVPTGPGAGTAVLKALRDNEIVCLLCDRDLERNGVEVEFFGERTTLPAGPATLALRTGAPLLPVGVYYTDDYNGHMAHVRPPIPLTRLASMRTDVTRITQLLAYELEFLIRRAPEQWHLFQPNWPSDPGYHDRVR